MKRGSGFVIAALVAAGIAAAAAGLDARTRWVETAFDAVAHLFYEVPLLERLRRPSQLALVREQLAIGSALLVMALAACSMLERHGRRLVLILGVAYVIRATVWIAGGNLPLVPGDSCHYLEIATSVLRGEGPVKHYVESYFRDYPAIREGRGVLDDWATPLDAYVRAFAFRLAGEGGSSSIESRITVAKATSFLTNLLCLPALYLFAVRRYDRRIALLATAALAVLPVHAIYAGFILRESLTALTAILAVWAIGEMIAAKTLGRSCGWAVLAGVLGGLAALSRNTALALLAAAGLYILATHARKKLIPLAVWTLTALVVMFPWAWATFQEYGSPFYSYTGYFEYNFSWTVHHYEQGNTRPDQFYTLANMPSIVRVKSKSLVLIAVYSTMIVGLPLVAGFARRLVKPGPTGRETDRLVLSIAVLFVIATLKTIADITQVEQLGRYYLPVFALLLPGATAGVVEWLDGLDARPALYRAVGVLWCALVWADPTWAYDASWLTKPFQLHWPGINESGAWIERHPEIVPKDARIMTWFPWELRATSDRATILMPRNYNARRIQEVVRQYGVTHILWGSFEPPPYFEINPEAWALELDRLRVELGLTESREVYRTTGDIFFPVRLYRLR